MNHGVRIIIGRAKIVAELICTAGVLVSIALFLMLGGLGWATVLCVLFSSLALGAGSLWIWNAIVTPRWWKWALGTGVDQEELITLAEHAELISDKDQWWRDGLKLQAGDATRSGPIPPWQPKRFRPSVRD